MGLLPEIPGRLGETAAGALEWPRLREHIASLAASPLGKAWVMALEPCADATWIDEQQQRTAEIREYVRGGGSFDFAGMFDATPLLEEARVEGVALEGQQINTLLALIERIAAWRALLKSDAGFRIASQAPKGEARGAPDPVALSHSSGTERRMNGAQVGGSSGEKQVQPTGIWELSTPAMEYDLAPLLHALRGKIEPDGSLSDDASHELQRIRRAMERHHRAIEESLRKSLRALSS